MNSFNCHIHFPVSGQWMDYIGIGFISCVINPLPPGKLCQGYIARIRDFSISCYFLRCYSWDKMQYIYQRIAVRQYGIPLGDVIRQQMTLLRSPKYILVLSMRCKPRLNSIASLADTWGVRDLSLHKDTMRSRVTLIYLFYFLIMYN